VSGPVRPPRALEWVLGRLVRPPQREFLLGDLREEYAEARRDAGRVRADGWYARELTRSVPGALARLARAAVTHGSGELPAIGLPPARRSVGSRVDGLVRDIRFALRSMSTPGRTALIGCTMAAGIGSTTAVFTIVDRVPLRAPPYEDPSELVTVWNTYDDWRGIVATPAATRRITRLNPAGVLHAD